MSRKRGHITLKTKLAAALAKLFFTHDEAKELSEDQILSLVQWDHYPIPHAEPYNGPDVHWNLDPSLIVPHRVKTAKIDIPAMTKGRHVAAAEEAFRARMLAKSNPEEGLASAVSAIRTASRFATGRKMQSRNNLRKEDK